VISDLEPSGVIELYKLRMQIEETFRDIKSLLGLKTLKLREDEFTQMKLEKILLALMCDVIISRYLEVESRRCSGGLVRREEDYSFVRIVKEVSYPSLGDIYRRTQKSKIWVDVTLQFASVIGKGA